MDRIARLTRPDLEKKLRDARKALREIASAPEDAEQHVRPSRFATWALALIFDEERTIEAADESIDPLSSPEDIPLHAGLGAGAVDAGPSLAQTVPFPVPERRPLRRPDNRLTGGPLREVRG